MSIDLQRQFDTATAFFLAGERCSHEMKYGNYALHSLSAPTITNYTFSVELALKLICSILSIKIVRDHCLSKIFIKLPQSVKDKLPYLGSCISDIEKYYVNWRYPFEHELLVGDLDNPRRSFIECYREIRRLRPALESIYEKNWGQFEPDWFANSASMEMILFRDQQ